MKTALTIAGSDNSGGAGIQADLKVFKEHGLFGFSAITAVTSQNSKGVKNSYPVPSNILHLQIKTILEDFKVDATKIGMIQTFENLQVIVELIKDFKLKNIVLDTVIKSSSGKYLLDKKAITAFIENLIPLADLITPNKYEAELLTGKVIKTLEDAKNVCIDLKTMGANSILLKGGHFDFQNNIIDIFFNGEDFFYLKYPKVNLNENVHGTGCVLSSAIASNLALGIDLKKSVKIARSYIQYKIETAVKLGKGYFYIK